MNQADIQKKMEYIRTIRTSYFDQLSTLEQKQNAILSTFSEALKNKKLEQVKASLFHTS